MELFERIATVGGVVLRVERIAVPGVSGPDRAAAFLLTFDLGRVLVAVDAQAGGLTALQLELGDDPPGERLLCDEEDPWWRVLGSPLAAFRRDAESGDLALQFRKDDDNPRVVTFAATGEIVQVGLEPVG